MQKFSLAVIGFLVTLSPLTSWGQDRLPKAVEKTFTIEAQKKECRGGLSDKQKIWLYEARARKIVPPFSPDWCLRLGIVPFTEMFKENSS